MSDRHTYRLPTSQAYLGCRVRLQEFPELKIFYAALRADPLSVTFTVNGHTGITINEKDRERNHAVVLGEYEFSGDGVFFNVARHLVSSGSDSGDYGTETRTYRVNSLFMLEFTESGGTGHTWQLKLPPELVIVEQVYVPHCEDTVEDDQRPGAVNTNRFLIKGTQQGQFSIDARYNRAWEGPNCRVLRTRQYKVQIL